MAKDENRYRFEECGRASNADRLLLTQTARERLAHDPSMMRYTIMWVRDGKRSLRQLRGLAKRWDIILPSDERKENG